MRRIVFGKIVYDTQTATLVYNPPPDPNDWDVNALYKTPEGRFFIFGGGGMSHEYLLPLSNYEAVCWLLRTEASKKQIKSILGMINENSGDL